MSCMLCSFSRDRVRCLRARVNDFLCRMRTAETETRERQAFSGALTRAVLLPSAAGTVPGRMPQAASEVALGHAAACNGGSADRHAGTASARG